LSGSEFGHGPFSPQFQKASELIGSRWSGAIIYVIFHGESRFSQIADAIPGISDRLLTERLNALTEAGILEKRMDADVANRPSYHLTEKGLDLRKVLIALRDWADRWV
jgi:DNA-binding HxlR family transcriptional regulator